MKLTALRPILWTDEMEKTIAFYTTILGFTLVGRNDEWGWASLSKDAVQLMLGKPNEHAGFEKPAFTGSIYFNTDDVNSLWEKLKDKTEICYEIETFDWDMREFAIYDNNGYILQFGQNIADIQLSKMKVIITGATGMVGEGVLLECLENPAVTSVLMVNRKHYSLQHPKLKELLVPDFTQLDKFTQDLEGYDACFYCAGISSVGVKEEEYSRVTYDTTLTFAKHLSQLNPAMVFIFVTGSGTDSSEKGKVMWARVKGKTENALMQLPFKGQYNFRPAIMKGTKGQVNIKTLYKILGPLIAPFYPKKTLLLKDVGQAMINAVTKGYPKQVLEVDDIDQLAKL